MTSTQLQQAIQHHHNGDISNAITLYKKELEVNPGSDVALDGLGVAMIQLEKPKEAIPLIQAAIEAAPSNDLYYFHLGQAYSADQKVELTIQAYQAAIQVAPENADYHFLLGEALSLAGQFDAANAAYANVLRYDPGDAMAHNNMAMNFTETGDLTAAKKHLKQALDIEPRYTEAWINLARIALERQDYPGVESACRRALSIDPNIFHAYYLLGESLYCRNQLEAALDSFNKALKLQPDDVLLQQQVIKALLKLDRFSEALPLCRNVVNSEPSANAFMTLSHCLISLQRYPEAEDAVRQAIERNPDSAEAYFNLGLCLEAKGTFAEAALVHKQALNLNPDLTEAVYHLTLIDPESISNTDLEQSVKRLEENRLTLDKQVHLYFALAKKTDRQEDYDQVFTYLQKANSIKAELYPFDLDKHLHYIDRVMDVFDAAFFAQHAAPEPVTEVPVFIVGMPRSGSTLIEQILGAHPDVTTVGEHPEIQVIAQEFPQIAGSAKAVPEAFSEITPKLCHTLRERYLESLPEFCNSSTHVVDKMLGNFIHLGLIALMFPNAKIIHSKRHPLDTMVSCFSQNFSSGLRFTTDLQVLAAVYDSYQKLISHWQQVLPIQIFEVDYETLVTSTQAVTRELTDYCGLPWSDDCLQPEKNSAAVSTASFQQVRKPVYTTSVGSWKRYRAQLEILRQDWPQLFGSG